MTLLDHSMLFIITCIVIIGVLGLIRSVIVRLWRFARKTPEDVGFVVTIATPRR